MTIPVRYLVRMLLFVAAVSLGLALVGGRLVEFFMANPWLNGFIVGILFLGVLNTFRLAAVVWPAVNWIKSFQRDVSTQRPPPRLLSPMAKMIRERRGRLRLNTSQMRSLLDGIGMRLDEGREISRYMIGLLVFLGLLGTFWGLMETITAIIQVIDSLFVSSGDDFQTVFNNFKRGLLSSLEGAGIAFSSSLFGLAGSLVLGFLDLQAGQAQNRFYNDLEEWLSGMTRLSSLPEIDADGSQTFPAYIQALMENLVESMADMRDNLGRGEEERVAQNRNLEALVHHLGTLNEQMRTEQGVLARLTEGQYELRPVLEQIAQQRDGQNVSHAMIDQLRSEFRLLGNRISELQAETSSVNQQIARDAVASREDLVHELRSEFRILARTIASVVEGHDTLELEIPADQRRTRPINE